MRPGLHTLAAGALALAAAAFARAPPPALDDGAAAVAGAAIYLRGETGAGASLDARRGGADAGLGAAAACASCHRRSGLGGREGRAVVPPITGRYLYRPLPQDGGDRDLPWVEGMRGERTPYTDALLARAIRDGVDSEGRTLGDLMPRYALDDADMASLIAYLKGLDRRRVPGVTESTLHLATIVTPDADPVKRDAMLDVMRQFFADRNVRQMEPAPAMQASGRAILGRSMFMVHRRWQLHVWELTGPESTWARQLEQQLAAEPVFAVISGLGGRSWATVHAFCERAALPCLFPNVEAPPASADRDFYSVYFSRGVRLEADLIGTHLLGAAAGPPARVVQVFRTGDAGEAGASALAAFLGGHRVTASSRPIAANAPAAAVAEAVRAAAGARAGAVVLWLRPQDVAALPAAPPDGLPVYLSGQMAGLERAPLPAAWRERAHVAYPFDLPERRRVRVDYALGWIAVGRRIPLRAEQVQVDTYLALSLLSETLRHLSDNFVRELLVERLESGVEHRIITGYYPRLALGSRQRFASKGGYVVRLGAARGAPLVVEQGWTAP